MGKTIGGCFYLIIDVLQHQKGRAVNAIWRANVKTLY